MKNRTETFTLSDPIVLEDLRWLVEQTKDWLPGLTISVKGGKDYNQIDRDPATITIASSVANDAHLMRKNET